MAILSGITVLHCHSIEDTLDFYQQMLQFVVVKKRELDGRLNWVQLMHAGTTLMLQALAQQDSELPQNNNSNISLYFFVNNIKELHHFIKAKNNRVTAITETDYRMQEFSLTDPEGNKVTIGMVADKPQD